MKKLVFLSLMLCLPMAQAQDIDVEKSCRYGGTRAVSGTYQPLTGEFSLTTVVENCETFKHTIANGTVTADGTLKIKGITGSADIEATINTDMNYERLGHQASTACSKTVSGQYELSSSIVSGSVNSSCERSGDIYAPILQLLSDEEQTDIAEVVNSHNDNHEHDSNDDSSAGDDDDNENQDESTE